MAKSGPVEKSKAQHTKSSEKGSASTGADDYVTSSSAPASEGRTLEQALGVQVRNLRRQLNLTVADLSKVANISVGMLSKIENGQISPSLSTLQSLAAALNIPITGLFATFEEKRGASLVRSGEGVVIDRRGTKVGHKYQLLGHTIGGDTVVEPYLITLTKDAVPYTGFQHAGVELIYMLEGEVIYRHGDRSYHLHSGDSFLFDSNSLHGPEKVVRRPTTYLSIITYSAPSGR